MSFTFESYRSQLANIRKMNSSSRWMRWIPGLRKLAESMKDMETECNVSPYLAMIDSMTPTERRHPRLIDESRIIRIATGSGRRSENVRRLLADFHNMQKLMDRISREDSSDS